MKVEVITTNDKGGVPIGTLKAGSFCLRDGKLYQVIAIPPVGGDADWTPAFHWVSNEGISKTSVLSTAVVIPIKSVKLIIG